MLFTSKNDNIAGIKYSDSTFTIMYRGLPVGRGVVRGFYQAAHSVKNVQTTVAVDPANLMPADAADLARDVTVNDRVEFRVMGDVNAKIRVAGVTSPGVQVSIDCSIVISPSKQTLVSKQCGFDGLQVHVSSDNKPGGRSKLRIRCRRLRRGLWWEEEIDRLGGSYERYSGRERQELGQK
ncbi:hypothetical protein E3N88_27973 [Mikania micrantha]|uniref:Late embryogenesis abundant protein LEA-2 subgroup domain-containing protein n=1 Tax=Mikania micrantha TaxID=192012 RepID=A0A5N6N169_9ASTR|nr:hypothetical protein E3N88_27973 [Mikania micrantha]